MWATERIARTNGSAPNVNRGRWNFIAGLDLPTDSRTVRIERAGRGIGHFTIFSDPQALVATVRSVVPL